MVYRRDVFGVCEEIAELLERSTVLQRDAHRAGNSSDADFLGDVVAVVGEGTAHGRVAYIGYAFCNSL